MSEKKEEGKKKGGKLPIIIAVVAILGGGGYFGMKKGDSKGKKEVPKLELAHGEGSVIEMEEKLYNLADQATFLRVSIAFHMKKGFDGSHITPDITAAVDDAVLSVLTAKRPQDLFGVANQKRIKRELAWAVNSQLHHEEEEEKPEPKKKSGKGKKDEEEHAAEEDHGHAAFDPNFEPEDPKFDSDDGPVLKVYFRSLAIQ